MVLPRCRSGRLSGNTFSRLEGSDSVLVIVDDRYKLPDCEHLLSLSADVFPFILTDSEEDASFVVSCVVKDSLYRYRLKRE